MNQKFNLRNKIKKLVKIFFLIVFYFILTVYAVPFYHEVRAFVDEKINSYNKKIVVIGDTTLKVDVSDDKEERSLGLSNRDSLPEDEGMLFIFDKPGKYGFWMKDMKFDLDIMWFNEYGEMIYFVEGVKPKDFPKTYEPPADSFSALEVNSGFIKEKNLKIGDKIDLY